MSATLRRELSLLMGLVCVVCTVAACASLPARAAVRTPASSADFVIGKGLHHAPLAIEPAGNSRTVVRLIDRAQNRVFVTMYILSDTPVIHALERAAVQGVSVWVLLEHHPFGLGDQAVRTELKLQAAGVHVRWSPPYFFLTHAKYMVLDDKEAVVSTANFSRTAFRRDRDVLVIDSQPRDVYELSALFRADWDRLGVTIHDPNLLIAPINAREKLEVMIASARQGLDLYGEEIADRAIEQDLIRSALRGVRVRMLLPPAANPQDVKRLLDGGVLVRRLAHPYVHAKYLNVDGRIAYLGSENFSTTSLDRNREVGVLLQGGVARKIALVFASDWKAAAPSS